MFFAMEKPVGNRRFRQWIFSADFFGGKSMH